MEITKRSRSFSECWKIASFLFLIILSKLKKKCTAPVSMSFMCPAVQLFWNLSFNFDVEENMINFYLHLGAQTT